MGSRRDDQPRCGDIDLYIEPEKQAADDIVNARFKAMAELHLTLGDQKIDLLINRRQGPRLDIYEIAKATGIRL
ncbi:hypothetical protein GCM10022394_14390 [Zobellella aerophila]|uniref:Polymerase nucleotidyl transferase domain-containing protein n=1 Tax=Zobellella aerophila TaxID=870480 RepID=A0ABP6VHD5_9GAMM